jgi:hypothetical protein
LTLIWRGVLFASPIWFVWCSLCQHNWGRRVFSFSLRPLFCVDFDTLLNCLTY